MRIVYIAFPLILALFLWQMYKGSSVGWSNMNKRTLAMLLAAVMLSGVALLAAIFTA